MEPYLQRCAQRGSGNSLGPDPLATGARYRKVYHCHSSQGNSTNLIMIFLPMHAGICGPAEASGRTHITDHNTNPHLSPWVAHVLLTMEWGWGGGGQDALGGLSVGKGRSKVVYARVGEVTPHPVWEGSPSTGMGCLPGHTRPMARAVALLCVDRAVKQGPTRRQLQTAIHAVVMPTTPFMGQAVSNIFLKLKPVCSPGGGNWHAYSAFYGIRSPPLFGATLPLPDLSCLLTHPLSSYRAPQDGFQKAGLRITC